MTIFGVAVPEKTQYAPRVVIDEYGNQAGVILAMPDYQTFLKLLANYADWELLPSYLQDAVDNMLIDEALEEGIEGRPVEEVLTETGELR